MVILLVSFGLSRQAIKYPDEEFNWISVKNVFLQPYFMFYGEVYGDHIDRKVLSKITSVFILKI